MIASRTGLLGIPLLLVIGLSACTPGAATGEATGSDAGGGDVAGGGTVGCLADRTWVLDLPDLSAQLSEHMASNGLAVTESTAEGRQSMFFGTDGVASSEVDTSFVLGVDGGDGVVISVVQTHAGSPSGGWELAGDTVQFADWDIADYTIQNSIFVNGVGGDAPITLPDNSLNGTDMAISCEGDSLTTKADGSPFTQHWTAEN